jgi:SAM-dependent methyltransferase
MFLNPFKRHGNDPHALLVGMADVKLGDRFVQIGCADGGRLAAIAAKVGLTGRAVVVVGDAESAARAEKGAADAGVLVEVETTALTSLPFEPGAFDIALIDDTGGLLGTMPDDLRGPMLREVLRVLRPAGRVMVIASAPRSGIGAMFAGGRGAPAFDAVAPLESAGFKAVRRLAEREGLIFVEGIKSRA